MSIGVGDRVGKGCKVAVCLGILLLNPLMDLPQEYRAAVRRRTKQGTTAKPQRFPLDLILHDFHARYFSRLGVKNHLFESAGQLSKRGTALLCD